MSKARLYLVAYDIACPKRWRRIVKEVKSFCQRSQLSVFVCRASARRIDRLESTLRQIMDHDEDRLMILDMGPAAAAAEKVRVLNPISDIVDLEAAIL
jgi:CRISPR-associated protein Cas2